MIKARLTLLLAALASGFGFTACAAAQGFVDPTAPDAVVQYGGPDPLVIETGEGETVTLTVELAETPEARQRGMMWREELAADAGMLFDFQVEQPVSIWMANTPLPLDLIYIRADGTIAKVAVGAVPFSRRSISSDVPVLAVLEINGGRSVELGIDPGDVVRHRWFGNVEAAEPATETPAETPAAEAGEEPAEEPGAEPLPEEG
ncbi:MAG: DUF192 domain-containing protein [Oceanicaulis sp.]